MANADTYTTLNGLFKNRYSKMVDVVVPDNAPLFSRIKFAPKDKLGATYNIPTLLSGEQGLTVGNTTSTLPLALNNSVPINMQNASLNSEFFLLRAQFGLESLTRSASTEQAVEEFFDILTKNMFNQMARFIEITTLYGGSSTGIGQTDSGTVFTDTSSTVTIVTIKDFAPGIWAVGAEGLQIQFYNGSSLVSTGADSVFSVTSVLPSTSNYAQGAITVTGTSTGTTALQALTGTTLTVVLNGAYGVEFNGIDSIASNTGILWGINAASYSAWNGVQYSAASKALTFGKLQQAVNLAVGRGLVEDAVVLTSPLTYGNLVSGEAANRRYVEDSGKEFVNGAENITFWSSNGKLEIQVHSYCKPNLSYIVPIKRLKRIGSVEMAWNYGMPDPENYLFPLASSMGYETRLFSDTALFAETAPCRFVQVNSIVNA
jgi:hypothetical protein